MEAWPGLLLLAAGDVAFSRLIPWLLAFATLLFAFSPQISALLRRGRASQATAGQATRSPAPGATPAGWLGQMLVSIYGGFFGAGMGILMMASLAIAGHEDVHEINALKNLMSAVIYSVTVVTFIVAGAVSWPHTLVMLATATVGGYVGAAFARKVSGPWMRRLVITVGTLLSVHYFSRTF